MNLEKAVGQTLMFGIPGIRITPEIVRVFRKTHAGGVIFFRRNFESALRFRSLIDELESWLGRRLLVAVDHEGGRVIHLNEGVTMFPGNLALGRTANENYVRKQGEIEAYELKRLGVDISLSPCLDVLTETFSPNIGIRSYGRDPKLAARFGRTRIRAMQAGGVSACAKHFPGQGQSPVDAHLNLPVLETSLEELERIHLVPFREAVKAGVDLIMSSHPIYPALDPERKLATFSRRIIRGLLREEMGFPNVIISDDLEMGALRGVCSVGDAAVRAVEAGHDIVIVCKDPKAQEEAYRYLVSAYKDGRLSPEDLERSIFRIEGLKKKRPREPMGIKGGEPARHPEGSRLAYSVARDSIVTAANKKRAGKILGKDSSLTVIFPRLSSLSDLYALETELLDEEQFLKNELGFRGIKPQKITMVDLEPLSREIEEATADAARTEATILFCYDAGLSVANRRLLEKVQQAARQCIVVLLRDPWDEMFVAEPVPCIQAYGFRAVQLKAVLDLIFLYI